MHLKFKFLVAMFVAVGAAVGIAFGLGVAYGHGNAPAAASSCCTPQQLQTLTGITVTGGGSTGSATTGGGSGAAGGGTSAQGGATGGAGAQRPTTTGNATTGSITALDGQTLTIQSRTGSIKVNLSPTTTISKLTVGSVSDLTVGSTVVISGTRKDDGSYDAAQIDQAPSELASLIGGSFGASATPVAGR